MSMQHRINDKLTTTLQPQLLEVVNESHMHAGPATESHFKAIIVCDAFAGKRPLDRHRSIYKLLADELQQIHALALHTYTADEYHARGTTVPASPLCAQNNKN